MNRRLIASILCAATVAALSVSPAFAHSRTASGITLNGVGSSADAPLFNVAFNGAHFNYNGSAVTASYNPAGSGGGQADYAYKCGQSGSTSGPYDWGSWDVAQGIPGDHFCDQSDIIQFPVTIFGAAIIANIPAAVQDAMRLTGPILDKIYTSASGSMTWGNSAIQAANKTTLLPVKVKVKHKKKKKTVCDAACKAYKTIMSWPIVPVIRNDKSGTSFAFQSYLCSLHGTFYSDENSNPTCPNKAWPSAAPWNAYDNGHGSAGLDNEVENVQGAIGYVETFYATQNSEQPLALKNKAGKYVYPTVANISADVSNGTSSSFNDQYPNFVIVNAGGNNSYPISTYSWSGLYKNSSDSNDPDPSQCAATKASFAWFVQSNGGQKFAANNGYVPLSGKPQQYAENAVAQVNC